MGSRLKPAEKDDWFKFSFMEMRKGLFLCPSDAMSLAQSGGIGTPATMILSLVPDLRAPWQRSWGAFFLRDSDVRIEHD